MPKVFTMLLSESVKTLSNLIQHAFGSVPSAKSAVSTGSASLGWATEVTANPMKSACRSGGVSHHGAFLG